VVSQNVKDWLEKNGYGYLVNIQNVGGGCINQGFRLITASGETFFLKSNKNIPGDMFQREAQGLTALQQPGVPRVPQPYLYGLDFLLMEDLSPTSPGGDYWIKFGNRLAVLHKVISDKFGFPHDNYIGSGVYCPKTLLGHADDLIFNAYSARTASGVISETEPCPNGGSYTLTVTWDGPDDPADCSQAQNPRMEYSFSSCREDTTTLNGTMGIYFIGNLCTEKPTAFVMYFTNFKFQDQVDNTDVTMDFTMDFSNIQYNQFNKITELTATVDGSFFGSIAGDQFRESYENIIIAGRYTTVDSIPGELYTLNGKYRGACLDGWVTIETIDPIFRPESGKCPTAGHIKISGNGEATIEYRSDSGVTINVGGEELNYTSCDDLPTCS